ncbi:histidine kinase [Paenibacillus sp. JX-17]|uniref:histidine kinase n=1 Tax=Paenibacillus lacisoli TaxID=3064525 RepID=A0ABT9CFK4_9BACL|nr:histidine kinase [Paenibacillus sp. JX-17]MDO7908040.1 histidine kinase [Paenibacillus sp. JX-17]
MTIRRKLLVFIPLLVLLVNLVTFFFFESGKGVQDSYDRMMVRILLYKQSVQTAEDHLQRLYTYLLNPDERTKTDLEHSRSSMQQMKADIAQLEAASPQASSVEGYLNTWSTYLSQEQSALQAASTDSLSAALSDYEEAEQTMAFIREEGISLVNEELDYYQPLYRQIQLETRKIHTLGAALFTVNALLSVVIAIWISRSITVPVSRLVARAQEVAEGKLDLKPVPEPNTDDELGILSDAVDQMAADLLVMMEKEKESLEKDRLVKELELQALQSQINPHFLFNTLNVLSKLALLEGAEQTSDLIVSMSNLLRYNLRSLDQPVTLENELKHVDEYIAIQKARFRDRVQFETDIDKSVLQILVPSLTIQPIIENAFMHGIDHMEQGGVIRLAIRRLGQEVLISIADNGAGMEEETRKSLLELKDKEISRTSTGIGTRNVFKRLALFYGKDDLVEISSEPGKGTEIRFRIPLTEEGGIYVQNINS